MSHSFSPEADRRAEALAAVALLAAALSAVIALMPPEGSVLVPAHAALVALLGGAVFLLPTVLALVGGITLLRRGRPELSVPRRRLVGVGLLALALLVAKPLLGEPTGLLGEWFTNFLLDLFGTALTVTVTVALVVGGAVLALDLKLKRMLVAAR